MISKNIPEFDQLLVVKLFLVLLYPEVYQIADSKSLDIPKIPWSKIGNLDWFCSIQPHKASLRVLDATLVDSCRMQFELQNRLFLLFELVG